MNIASIHIQNFRKLLDCRIDFSKKTTLFVGANNSGKTSAMDALAKFLAGRKFNFNDFTISNRTNINKIGSQWIENPIIPENLTEWDSIVPKMDVWLEVSSQEIHYVASIIPTLKWRGGKLGVRLALFPKEIINLFNEFREEYSAIRKIEETNPKTQIKLKPKNLCDFIEEKITTHFILKAYILDPSYSEKDSSEPTNFDMECSANNPLKGIIKIDMIDAQRGFSDPDTSDEKVKVQNQLSSQLRSYYDKHLDPEKNPSIDDLKMLEATEGARSIFQENLKEKFKPAISELEELGYPGVADPKLTITTKVAASESLKHDSAVQYSLSKNDSTLNLPEKYNGLGYQNLISMVFELMCFRDGWMREGKIKQSQREESIVIEPLHLVLVEEPEAHLHVQV